MHIKRQNHTLVRNERTNRPHPYDRHKRTPRTPNGHLKSRRDRLHNQGRTTRRDVQTIPPKVLPEEVRVRRGVVSKPTIR